MCVGEGGVTVDVFSNKQSFKAKCLNMQCRFFPQPPFYLKIIGVNSFIRIGLHIYKLLTDKSTEIMDKACGCIFALRC